MIKLPFNRKSQDATGERPTAAFTAHCAQELERRRDAGDAFDEVRFQAAMDLALARLRAIGEEERA